MHEIREYSTAQIKAQTDPTDKAHTGEIGWLYRKYNNTNTKQGDTTNYSNYRGISLINFANKVLSNILLKRLASYVENTLGKY